MSRIYLFAGAAAAVVLVLLYLDKKGSPAAIGQAVGGAVIEAAAGGVIGIGQAVGIPETNMTECEKAIAEGRTWDASFACPAGTFIKSLF